MSTWYSVMADDEKLSRSKMGTDTVYNTLKTHTKYAHIVRGRPTLKDVERFRNGSVYEPYERSLYERTFMSEPFIEKHAISTELSNVNREKHRRKSHRVFRRDRDRYVNAKNNKMKGLNFNCRERIRQSIRKVKYRVSRYLTLFSWNKLMCSYKNEAECSKLLQL